jgi:hypothetical protein
VSPVKYELGFYIPIDDILHSHNREVSTLPLGFIITSVGDVLRRHVQNVRRASATAPQKDRNRILRLRAASALSKLITSSQRIVLTDVPH